MSSTNASDPKALKGRKGSGGDEVRLTASYVGQINANGPQAVLKVVSQARGFRVNAVLDYIERADKSEEKQLDAENQNGKILKGKEDMRQVYEEWRKDFERAKPQQKKSIAPEPKQRTTTKEPHHVKRRIPPPHRRNRLHHLSELALVQDKERAVLLLQGNVRNSLPGSRADSGMRGAATSGGITQKPTPTGKTPSRRLPRHATHAILSADCENNPANARKVLRAARDILQEQLGSEGYRYVMVLHQDTKNPHVHVVINNYNLDPNKAKLRLNPPDLFVMRSRFAERMTELGLEQYATRRLDRPELLAKIEKGIEDLKAKGAWYERKLFEAASINPATPGYEPARGFEGRPTPFDAFAKRIAMAKSIAKLKEQVKETTLPFSPERKEKMRVLRELGKQLIDPKAPDFKRLVDQLELKFSKDQEKAVKQIAALREPEAGEPKPLTHRRRLERKRAVEKITERQLKRIEETRKAINTDTRISNEQRRQVLNKLNQYAQNLSRGVSRELSR